MFLSAPLPILASFAVLGTSLVTLNHAFTKARIALNEREALLRSLHALVLLTLGGMRELVGQGTLFDQAHLMFGEAARRFTINIEDFPGMLIAILPPGAFIGLGLLIMLKNLIDQRLAARAVEKSEYPEGAEHEF